LEAAPNPTAYVVNPHLWADLLGLSPYPSRIEGGGWDVRGHNPLGIVPDDAEMRTLEPDPNGGAQKGVECKWEDPETGNKVRLRVHDKDGTAPAGANAANGDIYRISIGGRYQDEAGNLYHRQVHNPNSPHCNSDAAHATHIPWPAQSTSVRVANGCFILKSHDFISMARMILEVDARARERAADEVSDHVGSYTSAQASALATLLAATAASEKENSAREAELHALIELASTGYVDLDHLSSLREIVLGDLPPQLRDHVSDLLEG
jgi:hypothetical protein